MNAHSDNTARTLRMASVGILAGGALWGLYWAPIRFFAARGLEGVWPGMAVYCALGLIVLPIAAVRLRNPIGNLGELATAGLLVGTAFSFYSTSVVLTEVARAILLFYLTPIWGTILGILFLGERMTRPRAIALTLALAGLVVITAPGTTRPLNIGDALALASGLAWALGSLRLHSMSPAPVPDLISAFVLGSLAVTLATLALGGGFSGAAPSPAVFTQALGPGLLVALYLLPTLWLTIWPARILSPGRTGLLLMSEVVVAIVTAAIFAGDPFGWREGLGTLLIVGAALVEVLAPPQRGSLPI